MEGRSDPGPGRARRLWSESPGRPRLREPSSPCSLLDVPGVPDAAAQPVQLLCPPAGPHAQVPVLLSGVWRPLPLRLLPDPREGELPALCPQGGLQVGAVAVLSGGCPGAGASPGPELASELGLRSPGLQPSKTSRWVCFLDTKRRKGEKNTELKQN